MKKQLRRIFSLLLAVLILIPAFCTVASAATSIRFSDPTVLVGETVNVTMTVSGEVAGYDIWLAYDSSLLQYVGTDGRVAGGGGSLHIVDVDLTGQSGTMKITLPFKTLAVGTARITITSQNVSDQNADTISGVICGNSTITITNPPTASSDSSLKSLTISPGTLSPAFSSGNLSYTVTVSSETTSLAVSARANHSAASVSVSGASSLKVGVNWVTVKVVAEDGSSTSYAIKVTRNASVTNTPEPVDPTPTPTEEPKAYVMLPDGSTGLVAMEIGEETVPAGFALSTTTVEGIEVPAITFGEEGVLAVLLEGDGELKGGFYFLDSAGLAAAMEQVDHVILWPYPVQAEPPEGYEEGVFTDGESERRALVPVGIEAPNHCLLYGINGRGELGLYLYDPVDRSLQRHSFALTEPDEPIVDPTPEVTETPEVTPTPDPTPDPSHEGPYGDIVFTNPTEKYVLFALAAAVVVLLFVTICLATMYSRKSNMCKVLLARRRAMLERSSEIERSHEDLLLLGEKPEEKPEEPTEE